MTTSKNIKDKMQFELQGELNDFLFNVCKLGGDAEAILTPQDLEPLNLILGGGLREGGLIMLVGRSGGGKSSLAAQFLANAQRVYKEKHMGIYIDNETTMTSKRLAQLGVNMPKIKPLTDLTLEKVFETIQNLCLFKQEKKLDDIHFTIVWDSLSNTLTTKEKKSTDPKEIIGYKGRFLSLYLPKIVTLCKQNNITLLMINQLRDKISLSFIPEKSQLKYLKGNKTIPGGNSVLYNSCLIMNIEESATLKPEEWEGLMGHKVKIFCIKNKDFSPNIPIELVFSFNKGIHKEWSMYNILRESKYIVPGAYHKLVTYKDEKGELIKWRRKDYLDMYHNNEKFSNAIRDAYKLYSDDFKSKYGDDIEIVKTNINKTTDVKFDTNTLINKPKENKNEDTLDPLFEVKMIDEQ